MARLSDLPEGMVEHLLKLPLPELDDSPLVAGPVLAERRVAIVTSAGLLRRGDDTFAPGDADYRVVPGDIRARISSWATSRSTTTGRDSSRMRTWSSPSTGCGSWPRRGRSVRWRGHHYSFMGATDPAAMADAAAEVAGHLQADRVDAVLLTPV